jgi:hypothetical protein
VNSVKEVCRSQIVFIAVKLASNCNSHPSKVLKNVVIVGLLYYSNTIIKKPLINIEKWVSEENMNAVLSTQSQDRFITTSARNPVPIAA